MKKIESMNEDKQAKALQNLEQEEDQKQTRRKKKASKEEEKLRNENVIIKHSNVNSSFIFKKTNNH